MQPWQVKSLPNHFQLERISPMNIDLVVVGAGPVGLLSAYLARLCGLQVVIFDKS